MTGVLRPVSALLLATAILLLGGGLIGVLLPFRADVAGFGNLGIGALGASYYGGLMVGCLLAPAMIGRVGHIRAFAASTALATIAPLMHALFVDPIAWSVMRAFQGMCFAALFMIIESWLSDTATHENRGRILATYTVVHLTVATVGMQLIGLADVRGFELFALVAILFSLAAVPVALTRTAAPAPPRAVALRLGHLIAISPTALFGSLFAGLSNSAIWTLVPLYGRDAGFDAQGAAIVLATLVLAGAIVQWPVGTLSDRLGRRPMLIVLTLGAALAGGGLWAAGTHSYPGLMALVALLGACAFPIYPLSVAHANDLVPRENAVETSGSLLLVYSVAAVLGPLAASAAMTAYGKGALFAYVAVAHVLFALVLLVRIGQRPALPIEEKDDFVALPRTTQVLFELDPRAEPSDGHTGARADDQTVAHSVAHSGAETAAGEAQDTRKG